MNLQGGVMWKCVKGFESKYEISNTGEVKTLERVVSRGGNRYQPLPEKILKKFKCTGGYFCVSLYDEVSKKNVRVRVHRLVAETFLDNIENKLCVNHKDGNKINNNVSNLEWATYSENKEHSFRVLGEKHWAKGVKGKNNPYSKVVLQIDPQSGEVLKEFESTRQVHELTGYSQGNISAVCRGSRRIANGYFWRYK